MTSDKIQHGDRRLSKSSLGGGLRSLNALVIIINDLLDRCWSNVKCQWRSQALKSGWAQRVWGTEVPQRGPGVEPRWRSGGKASRSQIYTNNLQLSNAFLRRFVTESVLHLSLPHPQKKLFESVRIPWPNTAGAGWARTHHPWLRYCRMPLFTESNFSKDFCLHVTNVCILLYKIVSKAQPLRRSSHALSVSDVTDDLSHTYSISGAQKQLYNFAEFWPILKVFHWHT